MTTLVGGAERPKLHAGLSDRGYFVAPTLFRCDDPSAPHFDFDRGYFDITNRVFAKPTSSFPDADPNGLQGGILPFCYLHLTPTWSDPIWFDRLIIVRGLTEHGRFMSPLALWGAERLASSASWQERQWPLALPLRRAISSALRARRRTVQSNPRVAGPADRLRAACS